MSSIESPPKARPEQLTDIVSPVAVRVAASLRLADYINSGVTRLDELAAGVGADPNALGRLLRFLTCRGIFTESEPGVFALTPAARLLLDDHPAQLRHWFDLESPAGRIDQSIVSGLLESVRTGRPSYATLYQRPFWEDLGADPALEASFSDLMAAGLARLARELVSSYDWTTVTHIVDVGGGSGTVLNALLTANDRLRGTLVDLPSVTAAAAPGLARVFGERVGVRPGSFFDPLPVGADVYLLARVLHDWPDAEASAILRRCAAAAGQSGRVLVMEQVLGGEDDPVTPSVTEHDLRMLVVFGGRERTLEHYRSLADGAGLRLVCSRKLYSTYSLVEFIADPATR